VTVVVAVKCPTGVVLATDSQATTAMPGGGMPMKMATKKISKLGKHVVYGGTGGVGAGQRIHEALEPHAAKMGAAKPAGDTAALILSIVNPIQQQIRKEWVELPNTQPEAWGGIFCGWSKEGPWIFEIDPSGPSLFQDPFAATGSGHPLAHTALISVAHFDVGEQPLEGVKALVYRAIENTCMSSGYGVELPVQMAIVTEKGIEEVNEGDETHRDLGEFVDLWKAREVETLGALAPNPTAVSAPTEPQPAEPSIDPGEIAGDQTSETDA
jgi:20S proteasome alpha/beta subunit